jgi:hypothetical protein
LAFVGGTMALLGGLVQTNPIWEYGPYHPYLASSFAQPDWYTGWLEGALRLMPPWRLHLWGWTVSEVFWPAVVLPLTTFLLLWSYPFLERWWTGDRLYHNLLDRPRDRTGRTAIGVAAFTFYAVLTVAGAQAVLGFYQDMQQAPVTFAAFLPNRSSCPMDRRTPPSPHRSGTCRCEPAGRTTTPVNPRPPTAPSGLCGPNGPRSPPPASPSAPLRSCSATIRPTGRGPGDERIAPACRHRGRGRVSGH